VGWIKTVDEYYNERVEYILNTIIDELWKDPSKKFIYVEIAFFERWWNQKTQEIKNKTKILIQQGRLQFTLGHYSMPDEATTYYRDVITNAAVGLKFLEKTFGDCGKPLVGWQIDPFGHSRGVAKIYKDIGLDSLFLGRIDYLDYQNRKKNNNFEFNWEFQTSSKNDSTNDSIFTIINPKVYWPPDDMCWDILCDDPVIVDDKSLKGYNIDKIAEKFVKFVEERYQPGYKTNNFMVTFGNDFNYSSNKWFVNIDKLIKFMKNSEKYSEKFEIFYSTPACYAKAVRDELEENKTKKFSSSSAKSIQTYKHDFFPYADFEHAYWTGYYSSKPTFKKLVRQMSDKLYII